MKVLLTALLLFFMALSDGLLAHGVENENLAMPTAGSMEWRGGREKTTLGHLKVLVVFIRYKDDNNNDPTKMGNWALPAISNPDDLGYIASEDKLPTWAQHIVSPVPDNPNYYPENNLTKYFHYASGGDRTGLLGQFDLYGDVKYVTTALNSNQYVEDANGDPESKVIAEVMNTLNGTSSRIRYGSDNVDFSQYDNWTFHDNGTAFRHVPTPDGEIDHVFFIFRNNIRIIGGEKGLGLYLAGFPLPVFTADGVSLYHDGGCRSYNAGHTDRGGIGGLTGNMAHEYVHYCLGGFHFDDVPMGGTGQTVSRIAYGKVRKLALMTSMDAGYLSSYECYRLGWITPEVVTTTRTTSLQDSHRGSGNRAIMIPLRYNTDSKYPTAWPKEYYWIENYVSTSEDFYSANPFVPNWIFGNILTHGMVIYHVLNDCYENALGTDIDVETADGLWSWEIYQGLNTPGDFSDDRIRKVNPVFTTHGHEAPKPEPEVGFYDFAYKQGDERDFIYLKDDPLSMYVYQYECLIPPSGNSRIWAYDEWAALGQQEHFFNPDNADIFNCYSNPAAYCKDGTP